MTTILSASEPAPFEIVDGDGRQPLLLLCDHASRRIPAALGRLGIERDEDLSRHIAWDIGAAAVTRCIAGQTGAAAVLCNYSRLVIDCNRPLWSPTLIPAVSDGTEIPGNAGLSWEDAARRAEAIYLPYHQAVAEVLGRFAARDIQPLVVFVHSFTPQMKGVARPWAIGIPHSADRSISAPFAEALRAMGGFEVGDDEPYSFGDYSEDYSICAHALDRGLKHLFIELRQDEVADARGACLWGDRILDALDQAYSTESERIVRLRRA